MTHTSETENVSSPANRMPSVLAGHVLDVSASRAFPAIIAAAPQAAVFPWITGEMGSVAIPGRWHDDRDWCASAEKNYVLAINSEIDDGRKILPRLLHSNQPPFNHFRSVRATVRLEVHRRFSYQRHAHSCQVQR